MKKIVAYIDLLGFKQLTETDTYGAVKLIHYYKEVLNRIIDRKLGSNAFEYFLPFSDSIFMVSNKDVSEFLKQFAGFLIDSFIINIDLYIHPKRIEYPTLLKIPQISFSDTSKPRVYFHSYPVLFRGGLVYEKIEVIETPMIANNKITKMHNLTGKGVVLAVGLEKKGKGPRIFTDKYFYLTVPDSLKYCFFKDEKVEHYEFLWTAIYFNHRHSTEDISKLLSAVYNLWRAFNHFDYGIHYYEMIRLVIRGAIASFKNMNKKEVAFTEIKTFCQKKQIYSKIKDLIND